MSTLFNKVINGQQFNFQPIEFGQQTGYHVDVKDDEGTRWEFRMFQDDDNEYRVDGEKLPDWITAASSELVSAINEHE
ncbi:MAG: hypothetical protein V4725_11590 [Bacteroidota bacterium]|nr:hypothetical protein [Ferruginibacter sp.]